MPSMSGTKDAVLSCLEEHKGSYISGAQLAQTLGISRNSVWKAVHALQKSGYAITGTTGLGYRLDASSCKLSGVQIQRLLQTPAITVEYHDCIDSTNDEAKRRATQGAPCGTLVVAAQQNSGHGRQGRSFFSPAGTGVYFSLLLRPESHVGDTGLVTSYTAVAVARAIEEVCGVATQIKWVNDVFVDGQKVCGILSEASLGAESGTVAMLVVGIGINVFTPADGFPADIADVAHAIFPAGKDVDDVRAKLVARVIDLFCEDYERMFEAPHLEEYRKRSLLDGRDVEVFEGTSSFRAHVIGIAENFDLLVRLEDGSTRALYCGEVHIPSSQF